MRRPRSNPWFSPPALQYVARFTGNPPEPAPMPFTEWKEPYRRGYGELDYLDGYSGPPGYDRAPRRPTNSRRNPFESVESMAQEDSCPQCGESFLVGDRVWHDEATDMHFCCKGCADSYVLGSVSIRGQHRPRRQHSHRNPSHEERHDVLCQCGWGRLGMLESEIPEYCPVCAHVLLQGVEEEDWEDNPVFTGRTRRIYGEDVPVYSSGGRFHHVRVADPDEFTRIRTKTLSEKKGIKARIGRFQGRGPRGGKTEIQSYLLDAEMYTPGDVVRWVESHPMPVPELVDFSSAKATKRRMALAPKKADPRRRKAKKKVKKKVAARRRKGKKKAVTTAAVKKAKKKVKRRRKAANPPKSAVRCVSKKKSGKRCKGKRHPGEKTCVFHTARFAPSR